MVIIVSPFVEVFDLYLFGTMHRGCPKSNVGGFIAKRLYVVARSDQAKLADERSVISDHPESNHRRFRGICFRLPCNAAEHKTAIGFCEKFGESPSIEADKDGLWRDIKAPGLFGRRSAIKPALDCHRRRKRDGRERTFELVISFSGTDVKHSKMYRSSDCDEQFAECA